MTIHDVTGHYMTSIFTNIIKIFTNCNDLCDDYMLSRAKSADFDQLVQGFETTFKDFCNNYMPRRAKSADFY